MADERVQADLIRRGVVGTDTVPWYAPREPMLTQYAGPLSREGLATFPEAERTEDASQTQAQEDAARRDLARRDEEMRRRHFIARHEPLLPANELGNSLSGLGTSYDTWRDVIDTMVTISATPALGTGVVDVPLNLDQPNGTVVGGVTYFGLSSTILQLLRDVRTPRLALCVRWFSIGTGGTGASGGVSIILQTAGGDTLPLGMYSAQPTAGQQMAVSNILGPGALTTLSSTQHLLLTSVTVAAPVALTMQLAFSFLAVHPHGLIKRISDMALNE